LDYFKRINDTFGHAAGDTALKQTAATFQAHLRKQDIVGRLGGEEFSMVLIDCDAAAAQQRCDQIRVAIAGISIGDGSGAFKLSASFGIVSTANAGHELRRLLADADSALYQAKLSGRNRVVLHASSFAVQTEPAADPLPQGQLAAH
jgi:diguanylate cyclase (GGDEF)-like protein